MEHVSFVILHYCAIDITVQCIESIKKNINYNNYSIIIVDNGSPDMSGKILKERYRNDKRIVVLCCKDNLGFAKGNNKGYEYAKKILHSEYIIITNSDTIFRQKDFINKIYRLYKEFHFEILGPDLITPSGVHQNPHRERPLNKFRARKMLFIKSVFLYYFKLKKALHIGNRIYILEKWYDKKDKVTQSNVKYQSSQKNVVLLGACLIFSPSFIAKEEYAFYPGTFMYGEEDILTFLANKKNYSILYSPDIQVLHLHGEITKKKYGDSLEKNIFTYTYIVEGCKILLRLMRRKNNLDY